MAGMEAGMCSCDYDSADILRPCRVKIVTARKSHVCLECNKEIKPGDKYEYIRGHHYEGGWESFKTCMVCSRVRHDYCAPLGWLWEEIEEALGSEVVERSE